MLKFLSLSLLFAFSGSIHGQAPIQNTENPLNSNKANLKTQYEFIMEQSRTYVNNKVVKIEWIKKFYSNASDSVNTVYATNKQLEQANKNERAKVEEIQLKLDSSINELANVNSDKDSVTLFGSPITKSSYKSIVWSIIIFLFVSLLFFLYKFKNSNSTTKDAKERLAVIGQEFEEMKKKTRTREQELMRKLQDEINKNS